MSTQPRKVALVTGAAGDIGAAAAAALARAGFDLCLTDRRAEDLGQVAQAIASASGAAVLAHPCDQADPDAAAALFAAVRAGPGRLDAAFVNAGYGRYGALLDLPFEQWKRHVDVNLTGGFLMLQGAARLMAEGAGGAVVVNTSTAATAVCDLLGAYAATKAGLLMLARSMASELGPQRIRVNAILPGVIETAMTSSLLADAATRADTLSHTPAGRLGRPDDVAALVAFLCSDAASYLTGAEILIDGGQTLHGYPRWFKADYARPGAPWTPVTASA